jgi:hypothetical protein
MGRILSALIALTIASAPAFVASAYVVAPAATTSAITDTVTTAAKLTTTVTQKATKDATTNTPLTIASVTTTGNGAPSGSHFNLNIIGVPKDKTAAMTGNDGHRIFVQLNGGEDAASLNGKLANQLIKANKISLQPAPAGESFQVLDANATDANGALFQLPADVSATWTVWARALGKPGGSSKTTTCATVTVTDPVTLVTTQEVMCSMGTLTMTRTKGKQSFTNVSADLLFITITVDPTTNLALATCLGVTTTTQVAVALFNGCLQDYFWNYQNDGLKLLQLRFYPGLAIPPPGGV